MNVKKAYAKYLGERMKQLQLTLASKDGNCEVKIRLQDDEDQKKKKTQLRLCNRCKKKKGLYQSFDINFSGANGSVFRKHTCKQCRRHLAKQRRVLKQLISMETYIGTPCNICECIMQRRGYRRAVLDHDHKAGVFRGVLCNNCNTGVGKLGDDIVGLQRAINYLRKYQARTDNNK